MRDMSFDLPRYKSGKQPQPKAEELIRAACACACAALVDAAKVPAHYVHEADPSFWDDDSTLAKHVVGTGKDGKACQCHPEE